MSDPAPTGREAAAPPTDSAAPGPNEGENPLLVDGPRIPFHRIQARHVEPGVREILRIGQERIDALAGSDDPLTFESVLEELDGITRGVEEAIKPASHLLSVAETAELRSAYNTVLPEISAFWTRLHLHRGLWARLQGYADTREAQELEGVRARHLERTLKEFRRAGAALPDGERGRLEEIRVELSRLQQKFSENVLDATAVWERHVSDEERLRGVPPAARHRAAARAREKGLEGFLLTLDYPSVEPILKYAEDRELRREVHLAYTGRCRQGELDNRPLVLEILRLRHELATLLGYEDFPDYTLEERMAGSGARAMAFEGEMVAATRPWWQRDVALLRAHAAELGLDRLRPWDVSFVSERLRKQRYDLDDEMLRPYFELERVMEGLFRVVERVFGIRTEPEPIEEVWHPDVRHYRLIHEDGTVLGTFYTDWFPRKEKRQGAWMNSLRTGGPVSGGDGGFEPHVGLVCGNFTPPEGDEPSLLTHREVQTVYHEFGHLLHHCASRVPIRGRSGLNVAWDFVELPSQLMENWTWEKEALDLFAHHHESGERLPDELHARMVRAMRFMGGWGQMRQLSFGTVDLALHEELAPRARELDADDVMTFARQRFLEFVPEPEFADHHILTSFTHLFSGGYAAGYYSYLWSEVLDADAFTRFREAGIFDGETGRAYLRTILEQGDSKPPEELFREFLGRDPDPSALLERNLGPPPGEGDAEGRPGAPGRTTEQAGVPGAPGAP